MSMFDLSGTTNYDLFEEEKAPIRTPDHGKGGKTLARLPRGKEEFMVIEWDEYKGHHYMNFKILQKKEGKWSVRKDKGITIKVKELETLKAAVEEAIARENPPF